MMKFIIFLPIVGLAALSSCSNRPQVVTASQFAASVESKNYNTPTSTKVGYGRSEFIHLPSGTAGGSVIGSLDTEFRNFNGLAVADTLVTGAAATIASNPNQAQEKISKSQDDFGRSSSNRIISTNTRMNLGLEPGGVDGAGPSLTFGFKRAVAAVLAYNPEAKNEDKSRLPSVYADITSHSSTRNDQTIKPKGIPSNRHLPTGALGTRTVQKIATGRAAEILAEKEKAFLEKQIRGERQN